MYALALVLSRTRRPALLLDGDLVVGPLDVAWVGIALVLVGWLTTILSPAAKAPTLELAPPLRGRWTALNSPTSKVPSHGTHGFGQTYAVDLVATPADTLKPEWGKKDTWGGDRSGFLPPEAFPGFGAPLLAPADAEVVRVRDSVRDHRSRLSALSLLLLLIEGFGRELIGSRGLIGNMVVLRLEDGSHFVFAHLRRSSVRVAVGDHVTAGQQVAECGNTGNSSEPHLHCHRQDISNPAFALGLPWTIRDLGLPANLEVLDVPGP
jgi:hypothetical protein